MYFAINIAQYMISPRPPCFVIQHIILVMAISCKGHSSPRSTRARPRARRPSSSLRIASSLLLASSGLPAQRCRRVTARCSPAWGTRWCSSCAHWAAACAWSSASGDRAVSMYVVLILCFRLRGCTVQALRTPPYSGSPSCVFSSSQAVGSSVRVVISQRGE